MRTALLTAALVAVALGAPRASAQLEGKTKNARAAGKATSTGSVRDEGESESGEEGGESEGGSPVEGEVELKGPAAEGATESAPGQVHTVEKGDTLWDLSQRYLGSPWYWPKVWSYNPEIANPHWIYPGNRVKFAAGGEETPTQIEVGEGPETAGDVEPGELIPDEGSKVQVAGQIGYRPKNATTVMLPGLVTPKEIEETGVIAGSFGQMEMLSYPETAYVRFKKTAASAKTGDSYVVFRPMGDIKNPENGERVGYLTHILGVAKVVRTHDAKKGDEGQLVTVRIMGSQDEIQRGDLIGPYAEPLVRSVALRANDKNLEALLVGTMNPYLTMAGEHHMVIVNKGSDDGVQVGNTFTVVRQQDGLPLDTMTHPSVNMPEWPKEDVGVCMAFDVKTSASLCLVLRSIRELVPGDRVEMRSASASAPRASR